MPVASDALQKMGDKVDDNKVDHKGIGKDTAL
jgi:hypothetical protein